MPQGKRERGVCKKEAGAGPKILGAKGAGRHRGWKELEGERAERRISAGEPQESRLALRCSG